MTTQELLQGAKAAKSAAASLTTQEKNRLLRAMADSLVQHQADILAANEQDVEAARATIAPVMIDRLRLTGDRVTCGPWPICRTRWATCSVRSPGPTAW